MTCKQLRQNITLLSAITNSNIKECHSSIFMKRSVQFGAMRKLYCLFVLFICITKSFGQAGKIFEVKESIEKSKSAKTQ